MLEISSTRRGLVIYLLVWLFLGGALGGVIRVALDTPLANAMLFAVPLNLLYAFAAGYSAYYVCRAYPLGSRRAGQITLVLTVAGVVSGFLWLSIANLWNGLCLLLGAAWSGIVITPQLSVLIVVLGVLLYGFAAAVHYLVIEFVRAKNAEGGRTAHAAHADRSALPVQQPELHQRTDVAGPQGRAPHDSGTGELLPSEPGHGSAQEGDAGRGDDFDPSLPRH
jgi:hypothetical protein